MKRGGPEHPKTKRLMALLSLPLYSAVGLLELLFHFTARYAPEGNVGKWSNDQIALAAGYDGDSDLLVDALIQPKYLDRCDSADVRLVVPNWSEHADDAVHKLLKSPGMLFADGIAPYNRRRRVDHFRPD